MSRTSFDSTSSVGKDLLKAFMEFPAPLALIDRDGRPELVNWRFLGHFSAAGLDTEVLLGIAQNPNEGWQELRLSPGGAKVRARAIRTAKKVLLFIGDAGAAEDGNDLDALRARIADLERLVATDHLTGAWSRAHFDRVIESELVRSLTARQPLSLILLDIDCFKNVNDSFGRTVGDSVLRELVRLLRSRIRASDLVFRWDGGKFVVLISSAGYRGAERVAENLRQAVASHSFESAGAMTISVGAAEHDGDEDVAAWFRRMDEALNEAKRGGRNRVVVSRRGNSDAWAAAGRDSALQLVWQEGYECGNAVIDGEHRELFLRANKLFEAALREVDGQGEWRIALGELLVQVQRHFAHEEAILERLNYAQLPEHRRAHAGLVQRALRMLEQLEEGEGNLGAVVGFLAQDVIARHLLVVDRAFFPMFGNSASE